MQCFCSCHLWAALLPLQLYAALCVGPFCAESIHDLGPFCAVQQHSLHTTATSRLLWDAFVASLSLLCCLESAAAAGIRPAELAKYTCTW
jgi:hypothetical protein